MTEPLIRNRLRETLARGEVAASMTVRAFRGIEIARIAATAGFCSIYVDIEHNTLSIDTACQICMAALEVGVTPLVRVPGRSPDLIGRLLDGGALGVIAPHVRTAEDAARVVACARFPPLGERGAGGALPHFGFRSIPPAVANAALNAATMVAVMIETEAALENVGAIAAVDGVDLLMVGTNDLCAELGITGQFDHPRVRAAYARCIAAARAAGKHVGVGGLAAHPDLVAEFVAAGARYVSTGTDLGFLIAAATEKAAFVRRLKT
ncbi:MAG: aldolase [Rhodospirillales bacterium]|jgi:2-keto-3-deoxy-L-rhamnonate aldolase RhmA|nr:aldolase [Rhodospirillales bacterium]